VVFKKDGSGYETTKRFAYSTEDVDGFLVIDGNSTGVAFEGYKLDNSKHFSHLEVPPHAEHFELLGGLLEEDTVLPIEVSATSIPASVASGGIVSETDGFIFILQEDATKVAEKVIADKTALVTEAYALLNEEVYAEMNTVFGTTNANSASAYNETWKEMIAAPSDYSSAGLTARLAVGGFVVGDALDTDQKISDYASAKIVEAKAYGVWRMQRIEQFKVDRETIINS